MYKITIEGNDSFCRFSASPELTAEVVKLLIGSQEKKDPTKTAKELLNEAARKSNDLYEQMKKEEC